MDARSGQTFVPRGVNWPSFEYACSDGYGYSNVASAENVGPDAAGAALIASWHINTVRIPLNQDCWLGEDGLPRFGKTSGYRAAVSRWVTALHEADLAVVLDLHWSGPAGVVSDGQRAMPDDRSDDFWTLGRADVQEGPRGDLRRLQRALLALRHERDADLRPDLELLAQRRLRWRRAPATGRPLDGRTFTTIGAGGAGGRDPGDRGEAADHARRDRLRERPARSGSRTDPTTSRVVASFHNYGGHLCHNETCWDEVIAPIAAETPVVTGEFGETDCQTNPESFMDWADRHGVGYLMWAWWVLPETGCSTLAVLADVNGTPRAPNGTALKAHLAALAPRISLGGGKTQALDKAVEVKVGCTKVCFARASGRLVAAGRSFRLKPTFRGLSARRKRTLALKVSSKARRAAAAALKRHRAVSARITIVVLRLAQDALREAAAPVALAEGGRGPPAKSRVCRTSTCSGAATTASTAAGRRTSSGASRHIAREPRAGIRAAGFHSNWRRCSRPPIGQPRSGKRLASSGCRGRRSCS